MKLLYSGVKILNLKRRRKKNGFDRFIFQMAFNKKKKKRNEKIGEERLIRLSMPRQDGDWLITQRKMEEDACFFTLKKCAALFFRTRRWLTSFHRDGGRLIGKFFVEMDFR